MAAYVPECAQVGGIAPDREGIGIVFASPCEGELYGSPVAGDISGVAIQRAFYPLLPTPFKHIDAR